MFLRVHTKEGKELLVNESRVLFVREGEHLTHLYVDAGQAGGKPKVISVREYLEDILRQANGPVAEE